MLRKQTTKPALPPSREKIARRGYPDSQFDNVGANLLMHIVLQIIHTAGILAAGAGCLPSTKWLEARPGTRCSALRSVRVSNARFNPVKEMETSSSVP